MDFNLNIDAKELVVLTDKLERTHKSALPVSVRGALDDAAFEAKTKHVEKEFAGQFTIRKKGFIKSHTHVNKSPNTFDVKKMESHMGVLQGKSSAGDELKVQELGGTLKHRDYIPLPGPSGGEGARASGSYGKRVSKRYYLTKIKPEQGKPVYKQQAFIRAAFKGGEGSFILFGKVLLEIRKLKKPSRDKLHIKAKPLYSYEENRTVNLRERPFIRPAGEKASDSIPEHFIQRAKKQFEKYKI